MRTDRKKQAEARELELLIARAGRAEAARRRADERARDRQRREIERRERLRRTAEARAPEAARRVFAWLARGEARALGRALASAGLPFAPLVAWMTPDGRRLPRPVYDAWRVGLAAAPAALRVEATGSPAGGGRSRAIGSAQDLLASAPAEVVVALERSLRRGTYAGHVRAFLRERARPDAGAPNRIRLG